MYKLLCYPKCSTCKKAMKYLDEHNIEYEYRDIKLDNPNKKEIRIWCKKSGLPISKFFNTSGKLYKEMNLKMKVPFLNKEECIDLLSSDGLLVKRPLLITDDEVLVGFKEKEYEILWKSEKQQ